MTLETPHDETESAPAPEKAGRIRRWIRRFGLARKLAYVLAAAAIASGFLTYAVMTGTAPFVPDPRIVLVLLNFDLVILLLLGAVVARRAVQLWSARRRGSAGSRLHVRLVMLFSLVAVTPTIVMVVFSALFLNFAIQGWFSDRVQTALNESLAVAQAYLHEHQQVIRADALAMAADINREGMALLANPRRFNALVATQAAVRSLTEAIVVDGNGRVLARSDFSFALEFSSVPEWAARQARDGEVAILTTDNDDRVRALVRLENFMDAYLYVGRLVEARVLNHMERAQKATEAYQRLEGRKTGLQITFTMIFVVIALLLLMAAVWIGLTFATQLARPISGLIAASERVRAGDLTARVAEEASGDELATLSRAFNRMTSQLQAQRTELIEAARQIDERRRFTETVLAGVSAGVIGLDAAARVNLPNKSASELLGVDLDPLRGTPLAEIVPEMAELLNAARQRPDRPAHSEITLSRDGRTLTFLVRVAAERMGVDLIGFVVTFDDITELQSAQRKAAWADVARRIAHEIRNPLTPIQLSAERLKRKYLKEITSDPETFVACTDTIVRQVGDIGRMVEEFSAFARMPAPVLKTEDLAEICRQAVVLQREGHSDITFETDLPDKPVWVVCDARQVGQALTNLLQNAVEAVHGRDKPVDGEPRPGHIHIRLVRQTGRPANGDEVAVAVEDNGRGLPTEQRDRLTEPYVTTRAKGTGLGLAIVKKIMEDHGGRLTMEDRVGGGARVSLVFPAADEAMSHPSPSQPQSTPRLKKTAVHGS